ncbi:MAG: YgiQ family radical SAM protein [Calditerrivibrio sp.]|uniref:YgiQ family radical SAM protein n=1 Tax=Calditerrivibrio sp. TaxID=2792612 RepID=UPI003D0F641A
MMFLPINQEDLKKLDINQLDIILVTGDCYIDSPYCGVALLGKYLYKNGFTVGIVSQPRLDTDEDIMKLGTPRLFWGVTAGSVDSMVANYTPLRKKRKEDDFTPGGINNKRPDRATISYVNLIKRYDHFKKPIIIGGIEASLRRVAHYDYWDDKIRKSILFDSKADILVYGMGEITLLELTKRFANNQDFRDIRGLCYIDKRPKEDYILLPSFEEVSSDKDKFIDMFNLFYENNDPITAKGLCQKHLDRFLIHNPPQRVLTQKELDEIYEIEFEHDIHPELKKMGKVKALDTIKFSITINRGCYGECNFCAITVHQGATVVSRSKKSIINEMKKISKLKNFDGIIRDIGGPTANMYEIECTKKLKSGKCKDKRCLFPNPCKSLKIDHSPLIDLLEEIRRIPSIKKSFVASGIRYDMVLNDSKNGGRYLEELILHHTSGQLKIAPEHIDANLLRLMGKPPLSDLKRFIEDFYKVCRKNRIKYFLTYYFIAAHPGCGIKEMEKLKNYISENIRIKPEQVQIFTPLPSTYSSVVYWTEKDPFTREKIFVEKDLKKKKLQKEIITV